MPGAQLDLGDVRRLALDLGAHGPAARKAVEQVVSKAALNIKNQMRDEAKGHRHAKKLPYAITYTLTTHGNTISAEVGPEEGGAGSLAFYYYGNSRVGPSLKDPAFALDKEIPVAQRFLEQIPDLL